MKINSIYLILTLIALAFSCNYKCTALDPTEANITLDAKEFTQSIDENPDAGKTIGHVTAKASDDKYIIVYKLQNQSLEGALGINERTGKLTVNDSNQFDYETNPTITAECLIKVADQTKVTKITVNVNNIPEFVTLWEVNANDVITISKSIDQYGSLSIPGYPPLDGYDIKIDWGDGIIESFDDSDANIQHKYTTNSPNEGYKVTITGDYPGISFNGQKEFKTVIKWGEHKWKTMGWMFFKCHNFEKIEANDTPDLSECISLERLLGDCIIFNDDLSSWDVSNVQILEDAFSNCYKFNGNVSNWDVSNVTNMRGLFYTRGDSVFDRVLNWNTSKVTTMKYMFANNKYNKPLNFDVSNVTNMYSMFASSSFNHDISQWDVRNVTNMYSMFANSSFNHDISQWDVRSVVLYNKFAKNSNLTCDHTPSLGGIPNNPVTGCH